MPDSQHALPKRMFVTGTGTDVGKTVVSAMLMAGLRGRYWKPIQSGADEASDTEWIRTHTGLDYRHFLAETYCFKAPLSPHTAAALERRSIALNEIVLPDVAESEHLIAEGAGGIMVPLNDSELMLDLIQKLAWPTLVVAHSGLGTINHTLLTIEQLRRHDVEILGVVLNGERNPPNRAAIERFGVVEVLAEIEPIAHISAESLKETYSRFFAG